MCGFIVASEQLEDAVNVIERAGLPSCDCSSFGHHADPSAGFWLPKHFIVHLAYGLQQRLFLCPRDVVLNLVPLRPSDPNPVGLEYDEYSVHLYDHLKTITPSPYAAFPGWFQGFDNGQLEPSLRHTVKALTTPSLIKLLNLLDIFSPPERVGVEWPYLDTLGLVANGGSVAGPYHVDSPSIQVIWDRWYVNVNSERSEGLCLWEKLADAVRAEWKDKLTLLLSSSRDQRISNK